MTEQMTRSEAVRTARDLVKAYGIGLVEIMPRVPPSVIEEFVPRIQRSLAASGVVMEADDARAVLCYMVGDAVLIAAAGNSPSAGEVDPP